ncbi:pentatricopeptide repeat-containing protein At1g12775, mitochondrial-like [Papaver somniferum]|uniref:pentatricopeptide repeat-containing protein At1g12775, mitochondrial-like n=1 Tax=Papaver somniferum TaxID=3469 RepID=UPI000E6F8B98|nr:pentatricopeptide repeat-containing protein At1g12775, mitochondrial-like [Papaver somniferum]
MIYIRRGKLVNMTQRKTMILLRKEKIQSAAKMFDEMIKRGVQPNIITCDTIITGLCRVGELDNALELLRNMTRWNCKATILCSLIITALCKSGLVDEALDLFSEMVDVPKIAPDVVVYTSLIMGCAILTG